MLIKAMARKVPFSPLKLRPIINVIRGKRVQHALGLLTTTSMQKIMPIKKVLESAIANAKHNNQVEADNLFIKEIRVDRGPAFRYFKPGAMGRSNIYKKRFSHISVILESIK